MIEEFKKSYKNGYEVMLKPEERDQLVEYINELEQETNRLKRLWETDKQNWACIMYEKEKEIDKLKNNKPDLTNFIKLETAKLNRKREQEKNRLYSENLLLKNDVKGLNNIINELEKELDLNLPFKVVGVRHLKKKLQELKGEKE